jgi:hypothetical protein
MRHEHVRGDPRFRLPSSQMEPQQKYGYDGDGSAQHMINISNRIRLNADVSKDVNTIVYQGSSPPHACIKFSLPCWCWRGL